MSAISRMTGIRILIIALLVMAGGAYAAAVAQPVQDPAARMGEITRYAVTAERLRELGIAEQAEPGDFAFPNRCHGTLTVSDELLAAYRAKGFSLMTLCLGLRAPWINFHPETGKPLAIVGLRRSGDENGEVTTLRDYQLQIPGCFRNGTPYEDCTFTYDFMIGLPHEPDRIAWFADKARKMGAELRALLVKGRFTTECGCGDLEPVTVERWHLGQDVKAPSFRVKSGRTCYIDRVPACADRMSKGWEPEGSLSFEITDLIKHFGMDHHERGFLNEDIELSPRLPRGYAYTFGSPEGDDSTPYIELPAGSRFGAGDDH
jgi:hypothetical protein